VGVTNIPDALRLVPGVNVARVSGDRNWVVAIRGLGDQYSKYVLVLIDGRSRVHAAVRRCFLDD